MAASATMLAWGIVEYRSAYVSTGQLDTALDQLKWATDYFIKAHPTRQRALRADRHRRHRPRLVGTGRSHADGATGVQDHQHLPGIGPRR